MIYAVTTPAASAMTPSRPTSHAHCGISVLRRSSCLQKFTTIWCFTVVLGLVVFLVASSYSYMSSVQSTMQAVFSFSATDMGIWFAMLEVGSVLANLLASYFFVYKHIPRILVVSALLIVAGCLLYGSPHFFNDYTNKLFTTGERPGQMVDNLMAPSICSDDGNLSMITNMTGTNSSHPPENDMEPESNVPVLSLFCFAAFISGMGFGPFYPLGLSYIDTKAGKHGSSKYVALILAMYTAGPIIGFGIGGALLRQYVTLEDTYLTPEDHEWIGAWWPGYFLFSGLILILAPIFMLFPKELPPRASNPSSEGRQMEGVFSQTNSESTPSESETRSFKGFFPALGRMVINPVYITQILGSCAGSFYAAGWLGFLAKFFEEQFHYSAYMASILSGVVPPVFSMVSIILGGYMAAKRKFTIQQSTKLVFLCILAATVFMIPLFFVKCTQYPAQDVPQYMSSCLSTCGCDTELYSPVCYNQVTYLSACQSRCTGYRLREDNSMEFSGCFCSLNATVTKGFCRDDVCTAPYVYVIFTVLCMICLGLCFSSAVNILMRAVPPEDKSLALGLHSSMNSLLGWIPAPVVYGALIDSTCRVWEYPNGAPGKHDWKGYCLEYDNYEYRIKYILISFGMMVLSSLFCGLSWVASHLPRYKTFIKEEMDMNSSKADWDQE